MTVSTTTNKVQHTGNDSTRDWTFTFDVRQETDITLYLTDTTSDTTTEITSNFDVDLVNSWVTYPTVASGLDLLTTTQVITIVRELDLTQSASYPNTGPFPSDSIENTEDLGVMIDQQQQEELDRIDKKDIGTGEVNYTDVASITYTDGSTQNSADAGSTGNVSNNSDAIIVADANNSGSGDVLLKIYTTLCAKIDNATKNLISYYNLIVSKGATFNNEAGDNDFEIKKNSSGTAYNYDAGDDVHTFNPIININNYGGTPSSPVEENDWPVGVLNIRSYEAGVGLSPTILTFGLPEDSNYQVANDIWNFRLENAGSKTISDSTVDLSLGGPGVFRLRSNFEQRLTETFTRTVQITLADDEAKSIDDIFGPIGLASGSIRFCDTSYGFAGEFYTRGGFATSYIVNDPISVLATSDTDTKFCCYFDTDEYYIKNRLGVSSTLIIEYFGQD